MSKWLDRDITKSGADQLVAIACPVLQQCVDKACEVLDLCHGPGAGEPDEDLPVLMTYMHMLELADSIDVLLSQSSVNPAKALLRSMFEGFMTISYIAEADSRGRSFAWLVARAHRQLSSYRSMSSDTQVGKDLQRRLASDDVQIDLTLLPEGDLRGAIDNIEAQLKEANYRDAEAEYTKTCERLKKNRPDWFSYYGGPSNIEHLAEYLNCLSTYQFLYRQWSEIVHAADGGRWLRKGPGGEPTFRALRDAEDLLQVASMTCWFLLDAMKLLLKKYSPNSLKDFGAWYVSDFRTGFQRLRKIQVRVNPRVVQ